MSAGRGNQYIAGNPAFKVQDRIYELQRTINMGTEYYDVILPVDSAFSVIEATRFIFYISATNTTTKPLLRIGPQVFQITTNAGDELLQGTLLAGSTYEMYCKNLTEGIIRLSSNFTGTFASLQDIISINTRIDNINVGDNYLGIFEFVRDTDAEIAAITNTTIDDKAFSIETNSVFIWNGNQWSFVETLNTLAINNGFYFDVEDFNEHNAGRITRNKNVVAPLWDIFYDRFQKIDNVTLTIDAITSEMSVLKVPNVLAINIKDVAGNVTSSVSFDGSVAKTIDIVSPNMADVISRITSQTYMQSQNTDVDTTLIKYNATNSLKVKLDNIDTSIAGINTTTLALSTSVSTNTSAISTINTSITTINTSISAIQTLQTLNGRKTIYIDVNYIGIGEDGSILKPFKSWANFMTNYGNVNLTTQLNIQITGTLTESITLNNIQNWAINGNDYSSKVNDITVTGTTRNVFITKLYINNFSATSTNVDATLTIQSSTIAGNVSITNFTNISFYDVSFNIMKLFNIASTNSIISNIVVSRCFTSNITIDDATANLYLERSSDMQLNVITANTINIAGTTFKGLTPFIVTACNSLYATDCSVRNGNVLVPITITSATIWSVGTLAFDRPNSSLPSSGEVFGGISATQVRGLAASRISGDTLQNLLIDINSKVRTEIEIQALINATITGVGSYKGFFDYFAFLFTDLPIPDVSIVGLRALVIPTDATSAIVYQVQNISGSYTWVNIATDFTPVNGDNALANFVIPRGNASGKIMIYKTESMTSIDFALNGLTSVDELQNVVKNMVDTSSGLLFDDVNMLIKLPNNLLTTANRYSGFDSTSTLLVATASTVNTLNNVKLDKSLLTPNSTNIDYIPVITKDVVGNLSTSFIDKTTIATKQDIQTAMESNSGTTITMLALTSPVPLSTSTNHISLGCGKSLSCESNSLINSTVFYVLDSNTQLWNKITAPTGLLLSSSHSLGAGMALCRAEGSAGASAWYLYNAIANTWTPTTSPVSMGRRILLGNGKILMRAYATGAEVATTDWYLYNGFTNTWTSTTSPIAIMSSWGVSLDNGEALINSQAYSTTSWRKYNGNANTWTTISVPTSLNSVGSLSLGNGRALMSAHLSGLETNWRLYNNGVWTPVTSPVGLNVAGGGSISLGNGKALMSDRQNGQQSVSIWYCYDSFNNRWSSIITNTSNMNISSVTGGSRSLGLGNALLSMSVSTTSDWILVLT